jgi:hypothetical protein
VSSFLVSPGCASGRTTRSRTVSGRSGAPGTEARQYLDGDDEGNLYPGQKPEDLPRVELPVKAPGDVSDLRGALPHLIYRQSYLPIFRGHIEGDIGVELVC